MVRSLRAFAVIVLVCMIAVTLWASSQTPLWQTPRALLIHPWFIATLCDCYFAFLTFYLWLAYRERRLPARIGWLVAILLLGNIAMASYLLLQLWRLPRDASWQQLLLRRDAPAR